MNVRALWFAILSAGFVLWSKPLTASDSVDPERDAWQNVSGILELLEIGPGSVVADVGAGAGYLSLPLARTVGADGEVYAVEISRSKIRSLEKNLRARDVSNVVPVYGKKEDPKLPEDALDAVVILNSYHEMKKHLEMLQHLGDSLKPGGRIVIIDSISEKLLEESRRTQERSHQLALHFAKLDLERSGFVAIREVPEFCAMGTSGKTMWALQARKPSPR